MMAAPRGPTARPGSPPPPADSPHSTAAPLTVAVDTNTMLDGYYRAPLRASAAAGDLIVVWSPTIARELVKVVYREHVLAAVRSAKAGGSAPAIAALRNLFDEVARAIEQQLSPLEQALRYTDDLETVDDALLDVISEESDRAVLRAALAGGAPYLLSLDRQHFPHGAIVSGVQCWHPDAFFTLFYEQNPDAYTRALDGIATAPAGIRRRLLP